MNSAILVKMLPQDRKKLINPETSVPIGPTVSVNDGKGAKNRTYQDLLKNQTDEFNFEQLARAEIVKVDLNGNHTLTPFGFQNEERNYWKAPKVYYNISPFMHADKIKIRSLSFTEKPTIIQALTQCRVNAILTHLKVLVRQRGW